MELSRIGRRLSQTCTTTSGPVDGLSTCAPIDLPFPIAENCRLQGFDLHYRSDDGSVKPDAYITKFVETIEQGCAKIGKEFYTGPKLGDWLKNAGFKNVHVDLYKVPSGPWPKDKLMREIGTINLLQALDGMEGFSLRLFTGVLGWTAEEVNVFCAKVRQELKGKSIHPYIL